MEHIITMLGDPTIWAGLFTLILLEIVLGIDNLVFVAVLADKLPESQRDKARKLGLGLALLIRMVLLACISSLMHLTDPVLELLSFNFSWRDLIMLFGGAFLVWKATVELHERLEGTLIHDPDNKGKSSFWSVITQIVILDAVFSLDSVITAVGMSNHLWVMIVAVTIAMGVMLLAAKPLTDFVNKHTTVVILCLSFLLMIGFSLFAEGFGIHIPKAYLYVAIGFSVLIEVFNQLTFRNKKKKEAKIPLRQRTADAILGLISKSNSKEDTVEVIENDSHLEESSGFADEERIMITGVLSLAERSVSSIMTPRNDISWIDCTNSVEENLEIIKSNPHSLLPVCEEKLDKIVGVLRTKDVLKILMEGKDLRDFAKKSPARIVPDKIDTIKLVDTLKRAKGSLVMVVDEFGTISGLVTPLDILEAIAGDFPDIDEVSDIIQSKENAWVIQGSTDLMRVEQILGIKVTEEVDQNTVSLAGLFLEKFGEMPNVGDVVSFANIELKVLDTSDLKIDKILLTKNEALNEDE